MDVTWRACRACSPSFFVAALAPLISAALPGRGSPQVVLFLIGGVIIGPHALGVANTASVQLVADVGLGFLFLLRRL